MTEDEEIVETLEIIEEVENEKEPKLEKVLEKFISNENVYFKINKLSRLVTIDGTVNMSKEDIKVIKKWVEKNKKENQK